MGGGPIGHADIIRKTVVISLVSQLENIYCPNEVDAACFKSSSACVGDEKVNEICTEVDAVIIRALGLTHIKQLAMDILRNPVVMNIYIKRKASGDYTSVTSETQLQRELDLFILSSEKTLLLRLWEEGIGRQVCTPRATTSFQQYPLYERVMEHSPPSTINSQKDLAHNVVPNADKRESDAECDYCLVPAPLAGDKEAHLSQDLTKEPYQLAEASGPDTGFPHQILPSLGGGDRHGRPEMARQAISADEKLIVASNFDYTEIQDRLPNDSNKLAQSRQTTSVVQKRLPQGHHSTQVTVGDKASGNLREWLHASTGFLHKLAEPVASFSFRPRTIQLRKENHMPTSSRRGLSKSTIQSIRHESSVHDQRSSTPCGSEMISDLKHANVPHFDSNQGQSSLQLFQAESDLQSSRFFISTSWHLQADRMSASMCLSDSTSVSGLGSSILAADESSSNANLGSDIASSVESIISETESLEKEISSLDLRDTRVKRL